MNSESCSLNKDRCKKYLIIIYVQVILFIIAVAVIIIVINRNLVKNITDTIAKNNYLTACVGDAEKWTLNDSMKIENIGLNIKWLEKRIGLPKSDNIYIVNECEVTIDSTDNTVTFISINHLSQRCTFDSNKIGLNGPADLLRFKNIITTEDWKADYSCWAACGNSIEPSYGLTAEGPHSTSFMTYKADATYSTVGDQVEKFQKILANIFPPKKDDPESSVPSLPNELDIEKALGREKYNQLWLSVFKDARMESLGFGH